MVAVVVVVSAGYVFQPVVAVSQVIMTCKLNMFQHTFMQLQCVFSSNYRGCHSSCDCPSVTIALADGVTVNVVIVVEGLVDVICVVVILDVTLHYSYVLAFNICCCCS